MLENVKLILTDMDGTLLNSRRELPSDFKECFDKLKDNGIIFAVASGRQYFTLRENFKDYADDMLFIAENGTFVAYKNETVAVHSLDKNIAYDLIRKGKELGVCVVVATDNGAFYETTEDRHINEIAKYYVKTQHVDNLLTVDSNIIKVTFLDIQGAENHSYPYLKEFENVAQIALAGDIWVDAMPKGINKGTAILDIREKLGISFEETMAFGDYLNDKEMLENVNYSYAMANAHPIIKQVAKYEAPSNDENGVTTVIKQMLNN